MQRLIFVTQKVDPQHPALAATVRKIAALAELVDEVVVLTDGAVPGVLPANCRVREFGAGSQAGRGARYAAALAAELARLPRPLAVVAHMCPIYAVLAAPLARPLGVPLLLWYTHWHATGLLRVAERLVTDAVSVDVRTFPFDSPKVIALGHGIDLDQFPVAPRPGLRADGSLHVLHTGRTSTAKGVAEAIRGVVEARRGGLDVRYLFHGPSLTPPEQAHRVELEAQIAALDPADRAAVRLEGPVPRSEVPVLLAQCDVFLNNMQSGATDKAVYEAAAAAVPVLASNPVFDTLLQPEWRFARGSAAELAARLTAFAALPQAERTRIGEELRARVAASHSVASWAEGILRVARARRGAATPPSAAPGGARP